MDAFCQGNFVGSFRIAVRWGDMDAYGHINNTVYFRFFEQARVEWLLQQGFLVSPREPQGPVIVHTDCTFLRPVTYPVEAVDVHIRAGQPGRSSFMSWYELYLADDETKTCYARGTAKTVWMDTSTGKSVLLPDWLRTLCEQTEQ